MYKLRSGNKKVVFMLAPYHASTGCFRGKRAFSKKDTPLQTTQTLCAILFHEIRIYNAGFISPSAEVTPTVTMNVVFVLLSLC